MLDRETRKRIEDYFDPTELVDFLQVSTEDVVTAFEDQIEEITPTGFSNAILGIG